MVEKNKDVDVKLPDTSKWEEEQTGFAPYWNPEKDKFFFARVVTKDDRDPKFIRYLMKAEVDVMCQRGPKDGAGPVLVKKNEFFSISAYNNLEKLFDECIKLNCFPQMKVTVTDKVDTKNDRECWLFKVVMPPEDKKQLNAKRSESLATTS